MTLDRLAQLENAAAVQRRGGHILVADWLDECAKEIRKYREAEQDANRIIRNQLKRA